MDIFLEKKKKYITQRTIQSTQSSVYTPIRSFNEFDGGI